MMRKGKPKRTRRDADQLFPDLPRTDSTSASRPANPFGDDPFRRAEEKAEEYEIVRSYSLPAAMELPPGYESIDHMREDMARAWKMQWIRVNQTSAEVRLPAGWGVDQSLDGMLRVYGVGVVRAECVIAPGAVLRVLPRYRLTSDFHDDDDYCRLVIRDRDRKDSVVEESFWDAKSGPNHPEWKRMSELIDKMFPGHRDPMMYWDDCRANLAG